MILENKVEDKVEVKVDDEKNTKTEEKNDISKEGTMKESNKVDRAEVY